ncbi:MAG: peptide chain release factor N(5)-glutamine methyltransferase [Pseudomonadota bacterium]|jgi:release factor glutamine methyltransferase
MDARTALREAADRLAATSDTARLDAEVLMAHAMGCTRSDLLLRHMAAPVPPAFAALVERRLAHEPVAYITGRKEFWGLDLIVGPAVLIPRPDSETLIEAAQAHFGTRAPSRILDLGTGSGALLLAALSLWPQADGLGLDRSPEALAVATANAAQLGLRATMRPIDWTQAGWTSGLGTFDLILANPPYIETGEPLALSVEAYEPHDALFAGEDGLDDYRVLIPCLPALLAPDGIAVVETGWTQAGPVSALAQERGLATRVHLDLAGRPRAVEMAVKRRED